MYKGEIAVEERKKRTKQVSFHSIFSFRIFKLKLIILDIIRRRKDF